MSPRKKATEDQQVPELETVPEQSQQAESPKEPASVPKRPPSSAADILILNASVQRYLTLDEFDGEEFAREFNTNVRASFALVQAFLPGMRERRFGRIVTIGSVNQWKQSPRLCIYAATKSAQANMIMNCARTSAEFGVTANNIAPGVIATDRNREALGDPAAAQKILEQIPARRFGTPDDCAGIVLLLCSEAGSYITGADIPVAGGMQL